MDNKSMAVEIGQRCRRFRNALGISQQKLADMVGTTPQNISKYEKEGIHWHRYYQISIKCIRS